MQWTLNSKNDDGQNPRTWNTYLCSKCGGCVLTVSPQLQAVPGISGLWPAPEVAPEALPARARDYFHQALSSISTPAGAVMLMASSIDSMLKDKGYTIGTLNTRIDSAARDNLITQEMATWAHEIRLDANDQRHADEAAPMPSEVDAERTVAFGKALAQFLYVLPARVARGRSANPPTT